MPDLWIADEQPTPPAVLPGQLELNWSAPGDTARFREALDGAPQLVDRRGIARTMATTPGYGAGRRPASKGRKYQPDPPRPEEVNQLLEYASRPYSKYETRHGAMSRERFYALTVFLWRSGLRISEALDLEERDLNRRDYSIAVRNGKGNKFRLVGMDEWAWEVLTNWLNGPRQELPRGPVFPVISGVTAGMRWTASDYRRQLHHIAKAAGIRRRMHPHGFRHACAVELWREGVDVFVISRQLGHSRVDITMGYLRGLTLIELMEPIRNRRPPVMPVPAHRRLGTETMRG